MNLKRFLVVCLLIAASALSAHADRDAVQFGSNINVARGSSVQDAVCFFCSVNADGEVNGDIVVFFGNVHIAGRANHDVVNFFGKVSAENDASIGEDLVSMFGSVRLGENASVSKDLVVMFGALHAPGTVTIGGDRVVQPPWLFWGPLLILALVIVVIVREFRAHRRRQFLRAYSFPPKQ
jgi:cytochrome c-type biogenesis protein CcmH/NrfF